MATKNDRLPHHAWRVLDIVSQGGSRFFRYGCRKCPAETLNGMPLEVPFNKTCGKPADVV